MDIHKKTFPRDLIKRHVSHITNACFHVGLIHGDAFETKGPFQTIRGTCFLPVRFLGRFISNPTSEESGHFSVLL